MHIVSVDVDGAEVELHPFLTVLSGFPSTTRARLVEILVSVARGVAPGVAGSIEVHGLLLPVDQPHLDLLGPGPRSVDAVLVRPADLPGGPVDVAAGDPGRAPPDPVRAGLVAQLTAIEEAGAVLEGRIAATTQAADAARARLDPDAAVALEQAEAALAAAVEAGAPSSGPAEIAPPPIAPEEPDPLVAELAARRATRAELEARLDVERHALLRRLEQLERAEAELAELERRVALDALAPAPVASGTEPAPPAGAPPTPPVPRPGPEEERLERAADDLATAADDMDRLLDAAMLPTGPDLAAAAASQERLAVAIDAVCAARAALGFSVSDRARAALDQVPPLLVDLEDATRAGVARRLTDEESREIDRLHDAVIDADARRESRLARRNAEQRYDEARAALDAYLERFGFATFAEHVMERMTPVADAPAAARLGAARVELDRARAELGRGIDELVTGSRRDLELARSLIADAGGAAPVPSPGGPTAGTAPPGTPAAGAVPPPSIEVEARRIELEARRDAVATQRDEATILDEQLGAAERIAEQMDAEIDRLAQELAARPAGDEPEPTSAAGADEAPPSTVDDTEVARLGAELEAARARATAHDTAALAVAHLDSELAALHDELATRRRDLDTVRSDLERRSEPEPSVPAVRPDAEGAPDQVEWFLLHKVSELRAVEGGSDGVLVLDDALRDLPDDVVRGLAPVLARIGTSTQVVYVGDAAPLGTWVRERGLSVGAVVGPDGVIE